MNKEYEVLIRDHPNLFNNVDSPLEIVTDNLRIDAWMANRKRELASEAKPLNWSEIGVLAADPFFLILRDLVKFPNGTECGYLRVYNQSSLRNCCSGVAVLPLVGDDIVLIHHYRHATRSWHWEIPRGFGEQGLSAKQVATKEIWEEIGGTSHSFLDLGSYHANTGLEGNETILYLAYLDSFGFPQLEEGIDSIKLFSIKELSLMIKNGDITDGYTIAAYVRALFRGLLKNCNNEQL